MNFKLALGVGISVFAASLFADATEISIDFTKQVGREIRPLHGVNNSPVRHDSKIIEFADAKIPFVRTHDTAGAFGGHCYVDIPNIFPDMNADENDPASYRFEFTDKLLQSYEKTGVKTFYRLGTTIENSWKVRIYNIDPPKDFAKWARVAEHVIRHYNEGWANGFKMGIEYWEIWNEPENPPMWHGTKEQFFEFYKVVSTHLRSKFPNIKIGGYASCGFYAVNRAESQNAFSKSFVKWFNDFLKFARENNLPFDFFSWHLYLSDPNEIVIHSEYVRKKLDEAGFTKTENIFNEWNFFEPDNPHHGWDDLKTNMGASGVASVFAVMQSKTSIDKAMYYDALPTRAYCGLYEYPSLRTTHTYCAFKVFSELYSLSNEVSTTIWSGNSNLYALAAANKGQAAFFVSNLNNSPAKVKWDIKGAPEGERRMYLIDRNNMLNEIKFKRSWWNVLDWFRSDEITELPARSIILVEYNMPRVKVVRNAGRKPTNVAGLQQ